MLLVLDPHNGVPVYRQLAEQIRGQMALGLVDPARALPELGALSAELGVNPAAVAKAYDLLRRDGIIEGPAGRRPRTTVCATDRLTRKYGSVTALDGVSLTVDRGSVVGLIGRNGSGKTTLLRHLAGLSLPTSGSCRTLGMPTDRLGRAELVRLGIVQQRPRLIEGMTVDDHLRHAASFLPRWDRERERSLLRELELDPLARAERLSPGQTQVLAFSLAVGHHPDLLLLDEPASDLDPVIRRRVLDCLLRFVREDGATVVISSHHLGDLERVVDHVICLDRGRVRAAAPLDELQERFAEWLVTSRTGRLPVYFTERYVLQHEGNSFQARVFVRDANGDATEFRRRHAAEIAPRPLNLERLFPLLLEEKA